jgi:hypothetical protein
VRDDEFHHGNYNREPIRSTHFRCELIFLGLAIVFVFLAHIRSQECNGQTSPTVPAQETPRTMEVK